MWIESHLGWSSWIVVSVLYGSNRVTWRTLTFSIAYPLQWVLSNAHIHLCPCRLLLWYALQWYSSCLSISSSSGVKEKQIKVNIKVNPHIKTSITSSSNISRRHFKKSTKRNIQFQPSSTTWYLLISTMTGSWQLYMTLPRLVLLAATCPSASHCCRTL